MKTDQLNIRITPEDKQLLSDMAWEERLSMSELVAKLIRDAAEAKLTPDLKATAPAPDQPDRYEPGASPDCNPTCAWYDNGHCVQEGFRDKIHSEVIGECPYWEPASQD